MCYHSVNRLLTIEFLQQQFGMYISPNADVLSLKARILDPPTLMYGLQSHQPTIVGFSSKF